MKVILSRHELVECIGKIQNMIPSKPTVPVLINILLEARDDQFILSATDLMMSMRVYMDCKVLQEGSITLPAKKFFQLIRELTTPEIQIDCTLGETASIAAGTAHFKLNGMYKSEFPNLPELATANQFTLESSLLKEMLVRTAFAAAREDSRQVLNAVCMHIQKDKATFIGADGKRLAKVFTSIDLNNPVHHHYLIPLKAVEEMIKILESGPARVTLVQDKISLEIRSTFFITQLLVGEYPDVDSVIPQKTEIHVKLHREELMSLLRQISLFITSRNEPARFSFKPGELFINATNRELGEGTVTMPVNYFGESFDAAFNPHFFLDILRHCKDETVTLGLVDPYNPGILTDSSTALFILMPMRLNKDRNVAQSSATA